VTYEEIVEDVVKGVEAIGAAVMVVGGLWLLGRFIIDLRAPARRADAYGRLRRDLGRVILLGLEILIIADIVRTIVVDTTLESVVVLGLVVAIRIVLSFSLEVEIEGVWPWQRWRLGPRAGGRGGRGARPPTDAPTGDDPPAP
jgi:uncharacterized membrane protein